MEDTIERLVVECQHDLCECFCILVDPVRMASGIGSHIQHLGLSTDDLP